MPAPDGVELIYFPGPDGSSLSGWFVPAPDRVPRPAPAVLFCHGAKTQIDQLLPMISPIAEQAGTSLLMLSYRGYGESSPIACVSRESTVKDATAAIEALMNRAEVDPDRVVIMGYSAGAIPALAVAAENARVRAVVVGGIYCDSHEALADAGKAAAALFLPKRFEPGDNAGRLGDRPLLVFHACDDEIFSHYHAFRLAACAARSNTPVDVYIACGGGHFKLLEADPGVTAQVVAFLSRALAPASPDPD
jgi:pimeloyl-ACP methyl ester carboxylesterase